MPPWPGKIFPVSLIFAFLFKNEKNKSPNWEDAEIKNAIKIISILTFSINKKVITETEKQVKNIEPIAPDIVLLGLILVNFGPLNILPKMYPPISDEIHPIKIKKVIIFKWKENEKNKNKKQKEKI